MSFEDALCDACAPISIAINIDPSRMMPAPPHHGGSIVDRDHKYTDDSDDDPISKMIQDFMSKSGMSLDGSGDNDDPESYENMDSESKSDSDSPFKKNGVK